MSRLTLTSTAAKSAFLAISTSLVCAVTMVFSIYVPQTRGFFNIGETMVYASALVFGPFIGAFAGGVGSFLADIFLGFPYYAPATLVIKASEGGIVGFLSRIRPTSDSKTLWRAFTFAIGLVVGILLASIGSAYYSGQAEFRIGIPPPSTPNLTFSIPSIFWYAIGITVTALITLVGFLLDPEFGWLAFTMLVGGTVMVIGYYIYQKFLILPLFGIPDIVAEAEIPINMGQMIIGLLIALPVAQVVSASLPQLKK